MADQDTNRLRLLGCPSCGGNKRRTTHTFATYRVMTSDGTLVLTCKKCGHKLKFKTIRGAI